MDDDGGENEEDQDGDEEAIHDVKDKDGDVWGDGPRTPLRIASYRPCGLVTAPRMAKRGTKPILDGSVRCGQGGERGGGGRR